MQCPQCKARLPEFVEGTLAPTAAAQVRAHLDDCAQCRAELARWEQVRTAVAAAPLPGGGPDAPNWDVFEARVLAHTREHGAPERHLLGRWLRPAALAAAVAALVLVQGGRGATPPVERGADGAVAMEEMDAAEVDALAADLDLVWDRPMQWDVTQWLEDVDPDALDAVPLLLAEAFEGESFAGGWTADPFADADTDWLTELEALGAETFEALMDQLESGSTSEGVT